MTTALRQIETLTRRWEALGLERDMAVSQALVASATWAEVAASLGCSPQAAHQRYRWIRHSKRTGAVWHERPLPL